MRILVSLIFFFLSLSLAGQSSIFGTWRTIDDVSGDPRSLIKIYKKNGKAYGTIQKLFPIPDQDPDPVCEKCPGSKKNKRIIGMEIIMGLSEDDGYWRGDILDPESGNVYRCKLWIEDGKLRVRGYLWFFYRTQTWLREKV